MLPPPHDVTQPWHVADAIRQRAPLTAAELVEHPAFKTVNWDLPPTKKGSVAVAHGRGGPLDISYEIHGHGPIHLVWIMGLGSFKVAWQRQTKDFAHDKSSEFTSLIFDNRGMGESGKPLMRYSSSEMARDALELLDHLGWTAPRQLHIVGVSMGGMIAQELSLLVPERIASLTLLSTAARLEQTAGFTENLRNRINMFIPRPIDEQLAMVKGNLFSPAFLAAPDADGGFPTNGDRFAAQEVKKRQDTAGFTRLGFTLQAIAAGWHHKSAAQLRRLADAVGRERIQVIHGRLDHMITCKHAEVLVEELGGRGQMRSVIFEDVGHVVPMERRAEFKDLMLELIHKTEALNRAPRNK